MTHLQYSMWHISESPSHTLNYIRLTMQTVCNHDYYKLIPEFLPSLGESSHYGSPYFGCTVLYT
ncbi:hypothetical protein B7P43_G14426 [Cryptotermes secundus]|uniref:Uncharacterized protein n=1 Tax=Cryptotermes secundus TaxID=105785 RepID=A0A2J7RKN3_9NEOP|nr:hypothetical protein B7P43_G14426 [Cryptotermes secundus]